MKDGFNDIDARDLHEYPQDFFVQPENAQAKENVSAPEQNISKALELNENVTQNYKSSRKSGVKTQSKQAAKKASTLVKTMTIVLSAPLVVTGAAVLPQEVAASFGDVTSTHTSIFYEVNVEAAADGLTLYIYNDFTQRYIALNEGENTGEVTGLKPNLEYTLSLRTKDGKRKTDVKDKTVRTQKQPPPVSQFESLTYTPAQNAEGTFYFTPVYTDENGYYTEVTATLTDAYGYCVDVPVTASGQTYGIELANVPFACSVGILTLSALSSETGEIREVMLESCVVDISQTRTEFIDLQFTPAQTPYSYFYFTPVYVDENGYWTQIYAELSDEYGNVIPHEVSEDQEGVFGIYLGFGSFYDRKGKLTIRTLMTVGGEEIELTLYEETIQVVSSEYVDTSST